MGQSVAEGEVCVKPKQMAKLLARIFPASTTSPEEHATAKSFCEEAVVAKGGELHFPEFLLLMRRLHDHTERARLRQERLAVAATGFSRQEVQEFRGVFRSCLSYPWTNKMTSKDLVR